MPSSSVPERTTPTTRGPYAAAAVRKSGSTAGRAPFSRGPRSSRTVPRFTSRWNPGGATYTRPGSMGAPSRGCAAGSAPRRLRMSGSMLVPRSGT